MSVAETDFVAELGSGSIWPSDPLECDQLQADGLNCPGTGGYATFYSISFPLVVRRAVSNASLAMVFASPTGFGTFLPQDELSSGAPISLVEYVESISDVQSAEIVETTDADAISANIRTIRNAFSMTMQHLADTLGVTRAVVYRWRDEGVRPRQKHYNRLADVAVLAERWISTGNRPIGIALGGLFDGKPSLLQQMKQNPLPLADIEETLRNIAARQASRSRISEVSESIRGWGQSVQRRDSREQDAEDAYLDGINRESRGE